MKARRLLLLLLAMPLIARAQTRPGAEPRYAPSDQLRAPNRINEQPRYGGLRKPPEQLALDARFVDEALQQFGSAQAAMLAHVNFGWHYLATGHAPTAIKRFNQAWLLDSTAADVYYGFSAYARQQGRPAEADYFMQLGQRHDVNNAGLVRYYGSVAYGQENHRDYAGAIATYGQILALNADNAHANRKLGYLYQQQQDTARASHYLTLAIRINPLDSVSYLNRGWLRYKQQQYPQAIADYTQAIRIQPRYVSAYANRALAYSEAGRYSEALADFQQCLTLVPPRDKGPFYRRSGGIRLKLDDKSGACADLRQALKWGDEPAMENEIRRLIKRNCP